ncbi:hypothetical protein B0H34DRAFT_703897 [Crassisporium funariophilum]|nr:hypothetical protein B0H34DRAFT_703897 [Crassisporium funariophilum]
MFSLLSLQVNIPGHNSRSSHGGAVCSFRLFGKNSAVSALRKSTSKFSRATGQHRFGLFQVSRTSLHVPECVIPLAKVCWGKATGSGPKDCLGFPKYLECSLHLTIPLFLINWLYPGYSCLIVLVTWSKAQRSVLHDFDARRHAVAKKSKLSLDSQYLVLHPSHMWPPKVPTGRSTSKVLSNPLSGP